MAAADATVKQTLARIYGAVFACARCTPPLCALPTPVGMQSFFASLGGGTLGIGAAGVLFVLVDAQVERLFTVRRFAMSTADNGSRRGLGGRKYLE